MTASKLPSAPSPAGETASELGSPRAVGAGVPEHIWREFASVPEPVSTEGAFPFPVGARVRLLDAPKDSGAYLHIGQLGTVMRLAPLQPELADVKFDIQEWDGEQIVLDGSNLELVSLPAAPIAPAASPVAPPETEEHERNRRKATCNGECTFVENVDCYCTEHGCIILRASEHKDCAECMDKLKKLAPIAPAAEETRGNETKPVADLLNSMKVIDRSQRYMECRADLLTQYMYELASLRAKPSAEGDGWIAVTPETMPADRAVVQCYRAGYQYVCVYRADSMWPFQTHSGAYVAATHWRLLPAPPSGQGEME